MVTVRSRFGGRGGGVVRSRGSLWAARASLRAAVPAAVAGGVCPGRVVGRWVRSAAGGGEGLELLERGEQLCGPWPVVLEAQLAAPAGECAARAPAGGLRAAGRRAAAGSAAVWARPWRARRRAAAPGPRRSNRARAAR